MQAVKKFFLNLWNAATHRRGLSFYLSLASLVCALAMLILYYTTGITSFTAQLSGKVVALLWVCIVLAAVFAAFEIKLGKYVVYLFCFWTWLEYLISEASYISNVFVSIDGNSFTASFILTVVFGLLAWGCALAAAILQKAEIGSADVPSDKLTKEGKTQQ